MRKVLIFLILMLSIQNASAAWWNTSFGYRTDTQIVNGSRPYQISLNISNSTGVNTATQLYCNGHCNVNFSDIRFTLDNTTEIPYWIENSTTGKVWINATVNGTINMYYGNSTATTTSNGVTTFPFFDDFSGALTKWTVTQSTGGNVAIVDGRLKMIGNNAYTTNGVVSVQSFTQPFALQYTYSVDAYSGYLYGGMNTGLTSPAVSGLETILDSGANGIVLYKDGSAITTTPYNPIVNYTVSMAINSTNYTVSINGTQLSSGLWTQGNNKSIVFNKYASGIYGYVDNVFIRNYTYPELQFATWGVENLQNITIVSSSVSPDKIFKCGESIISLNTLGAVTSVDAIVSPTQMVQPMIPGSGRTTPEWAPTVIIPMTYNGTYWNGIFGNDPTLLWGTRSISFNITDGTSIIFPTNLTIFVYNSIETCTGTGKNSYQNYTHGIGNYTNRLASSDMDLLTWSIYPWLQYWGYMFYMIIIFITIVVVYMKTQNAMHVLFTLFIFLIVLSTTGAVPMSYRSYVIAFIALCLAAVFYRLYTRD